MVKKTVTGLIRLSAFLIILTLISAKKTDAKTWIPENISISVDSSGQGILRGINASFDNNIYISLRDAAVVFSGSSKPFNPDITGGSVAIITGEPYSDEFDHSGWKEEELDQTSGAEASVIPLTVDGNDRRYFSIMRNMGDYYDCFMSPMDLAMIFDIYMEMNEDSGIIVDTSSGFSVNPALLESYGYFNGFNTVVVGDATTGEVFYGYNADTPFPIASTTKLMTYLLTMDAISSGAISEEDKVTISKEAADLSASENGSVALKAGWEIPVKDLILGTMLPSSNECALSLAEYIAGSGDSFVEMMNEKAKELSLTSAAFYNSNGLPVYSDTLVPAKVQNEMSGYDMFRMCSHILNTYPQVKEVTSLRRASMESLSLELKNTNGLLYNMDEINGLKTGTTDKSGACLVTSLTVPASDGDHDIVVVELGAENSQARMRVSELMARYGKNVIEGEAAKTGYTAGVEEEEEGKITAEDIVRLVVDYAIKKK